ncbi:MAG: GerMN domain-containing protein [Lachnospiraceae bacterium]|nr:GerMN domain-containing protein [Lachnospiraceae bacterium]
MSAKRGLTALFAAVAMLLLVGGCGRQEQSSSYTIYYVNVSGTSLYEVSYVPSAETFDEMVTELIGKMEETATDAGYISAIPETVEFQGYERGIDALRLDFSGEYYDLSNTEEVLLRAAVVKTICQIPGVTKIMITVDSEQLVDANGEAIAAMDAESFIDTKDGGINSYQTASLVLYFPNQDGTELKKEVRNVDYSSNMVLERVIVEQLIAGSEYSDRRAIFASSVEILDVSTKNGICTIDFSEEFNQTPSENAGSAEAALYAIVDSICETSDSVDGVKFTVEGSSNVLFRDEIDLGSVFILNQSIIETETLESDTEISAADRLAVDTTDLEDSSAPESESTSRLSAENASDPDQETTSDASSGDASGSGQETVSGSVVAGSDETESEEQSEASVVSDGVLAGAN